mgnify:CR=1 FL=1
MTVYYLNNSLYIDMMNRFMPKMEDRTYCALLQTALKECREKNYIQHPPCREIEQFIKTLDCYSKEAKPLYKVKSNFNFDQLLGKT